MCVPGPKPRTTPPTVEGGLIVVTDEVSEHLVFHAADPDAGRGLIRFAFCKRPQTLEAAAARLRGLGGAT